MLQFAVCSLCRVHSDGNRKQNWVQRFSSWNKVARCSIPFQNENERVERKIKQVEIFNFATKMAVTRMPMVRIDAIESKPFAKIYIIVIRMTMLSLNAGRQTHCTRHSTSSSRSVVRLVRHSVSQLDELGRLMVAWIDRNHCLNMHFISRWTWVAFFSIFSTLSFETIKYKTYLKLGPDKV